MQANNQLYNELKTIMKDHVYRYSEQPFLLASGRESNHYFNCKEITLHPARLKLLSRNFVEWLIPEFSSTAPESVGGLTLGADPIAYSLALEYNMSGSLVYPLVVRKQAKDHGTQKLIEGFAKEVRSCLVVDDVITTGGSTLKAVQALRESGIQVTQGICILDREEGGRENLKENGVEMYSIFKKSDFY